MFKVVEFAVPLAGRLKTVTAGAAVSVGDWVVMSGSDGTYGPAGDAAAVVSGLAMSSATGAGKPLAVLVPTQGDVFAGPYAGSPADDDAGEQFELDVTEGAQALNFGGTTNKLFTVLSYDETAESCRFTVIPEKVTPYGSAAV